MNDNNLYDRFYYQHGCGTPYERNEIWLTHFTYIANHIIQRIAPRTVLDMGCAMGFLVETLRDRGVEACGIDVSEYALQNVRQDIQQFCVLGSILDPITRHYDLIVCIEVLEHLPAADAGNAIANLCAGSDQVLFSSTPIDYKEATHLNVQQPEYWTEIFAIQGFFRDVDFDASFILPWGVLYRSTNEPVTRHIRNYDRRFWHLTNENMQQRTLINELRNNLSAADGRELSLLTDFQTLQQKVEQERDEHKQLLDNKDIKILGLEKQLQDLQSSETWRIVQMITQYRQRLGLGGK